MEIALAGSCCAAWRWPQPVGSSDTVPRRRWIVPPPLLLVAGVTVRVLRALLLRRPVSGSRLVAAADAITLAVIAVVCPGWVARWLLEQRW